MEEESIRKLSIDPIADERLGRVTGRLEPRDKGRFRQAVSVSPQILAGTIKAYGVSSRERLAILPDVPTAREAGIDYEMSIWAGMFAPKGTPKDVVVKLARALDRALDDRGVKKRLADLGGSLPRKDERTPAKFDAFVKAEIARWAPILKTANFDLDAQSWCLRGAGCAKSMRSG